MDSSFGPIHRSKEKTGRNDPCPCGSGKKYKKCCLEKDNLSSDAYIPTIEYDIQRKMKDVSTLSSSDIFTLHSWELSELNCDELTPLQLKSAMRSSMKQDETTLAIGFARELRKHYNEKTGTRRSEPTTIKLGVKRLSFAEEDEKYDEYLEELVTGLEMSGKRELIKPLLDLFFDRESDDYNYALFMVALEEKDTASIMQLLENFSYLGIDDYEHLSRLFFLLNREYPGLARMAMRSEIAAFPTATLDIGMMIETLDQSEMPEEDDPAIESFEILFEYLDSSIEGSDNHSYEMETLQKELRKSRQESQGLQKEIKILKENIENQTEVDYLQEDNLQESIHTVSERLDKNRVKMNNLKEVIREKQQEILDLKSRIKENDSPDDQEGYESQNGHDKWEEDLSDSDTAHGSLTPPEFSECFRKTLSDDLLPGKKALMAATGFAVREPMTMKQTKKLKALDNWFSIRIGIHHRLLIECKPGQAPIIQHLIHRKDLEKTIKQIR